AELRNRRTPRYFDQLDFGLEKTATNFLSSFLITAIHNEHFITDVASLLHKAIEAFSDRWQTIHRCDHDRDGGRAFGRRRIHPELCGRCLGSSAAEPGAQ